MNRLIAAAVVLLLGGTAHADMAAPWPINYRVPVRVTITADPPPAGVEMFVVSVFDGRGTPRRLSADAPVVLEAKDGGVMFNVFAVDSTTLTRFAGSAPPPDWFKFDNPECKTVGGERVRGRLEFFDGRSEEVRDYLVEWQEEKGRLRKVSDNEGSRSWYTWSCCGSCVAIPVGLIWLVGWMLERLARRQPQVFPPQRLPPPSPPGI